jgi:hypothetical protein
MIDLFVEDFANMINLMEAAYSKRGRHERRFGTDLLTEVNRQKTTGRHLRSNT